MRIKNRLLLKLITLIIVGTKGVHFKHNYRDYLLEDMISEAWLGTHIVVDVEEDKLTFNYCRGKSGDIMELEYRFMWNLIFPKGTAMHSIETLFNYFNMDVRRFTITEENVWEEILL